MRYSSAEAFRRALEDRLKARRPDDPSRLARDRKRVAFDRLLARLLVVAPEEWVLKGGFALDLRLEDLARSTRDVDLSWHSDSDEVADRVSAATECGVADFFEFQVSRTRHDPEDLGGAIRYRVVARLAGRQFESFLLDIGPGTRHNSIDRLECPDLLSFAGIQPLIVPAVGIEWQISEKLHAYTGVYAGRPSTRAKDLVDLVLIAKSFAPAADSVRSAIESTFATRDTHPVPAYLPDPPVGWSVPFAKLARTVGIPADLGAAHAVAAGMLDPVLAGKVERGRWNPETMCWINSTAGR